MAPRGKPFAKGKSANPGGRPKLDRELRIRAKKLVDDKVIAYWEDEITERTREIITPAGPMDMTCRGKDAMKASELLAAYGYGKPVQGVELAGKDGGPVEVAARVVIELPDNGRGDR